jgi:hypothetical protein
MPAKPEMREREIIPWHERPYIRDYVLCKIRTEDYVMNTLWIVVIAAVVIYLAYNYYAKMIDKNVIQADVKKATPAKMYMDGVDFMPTSRNVLYGYHFKSIAAAGPISALLPPRTCGAGFRLWSG